MHLSFAVVLILGVAVVADPEGSCVSRRPPRGTAGASQQGAELAELACAPDAARGCEPCDHIAFAGLDPPESEL